MEPRTNVAFALLILAQTAHSIEEYVFRLFDVFRPTRWVSTLFTSNAALGFALANAAIILFAVWCYVARVRPGHRSAHAYAWFWVCVEFTNGIGHVILASLDGGYFPGVGTAPLLLAAACYLGVTLATPAQA
ncbi:MAG TPA: HXXEE domain-containing protein [Vicinamibacterales bacterium]|nr:HXXEE domain-containing protein [Vicinamibacterales bacterium]